MKLLTSWKIACGLALTLIGLAQTTSAAAAPQGSAVASDVAAILEAIKANPDSESRNVDTEHARFILNECSFLFEANFNYAVAHFRQGEYTKARWARDLARMVPEILSINEPEARGYARSNGDPRNNPYAAESIETMCMAFYRFQYRPGGTPSVIAAAPAARRAPASSQPAIAETRPIPATRPSVKAARVFNDAAAAAAAVTAHPGGFDRFADDALAGRSPTDIARDDAATRSLWAGEKTILSQYPVTQCSDSDDRAAFAQCLKLRNETIFRRAEAEKALLEKERPNMSDALYQSFSVKFGIAMGENLARDSCAKLASSTAACNLSAANASRSDIPARVIARDGLRALECVKLEQLARSSSSTSGGGSVLANYCTDTVSIGWCSTGGECERGGGNLTNLMAGHSWPVDATHEVRWGACHGANTLHGDPGSKGLQYTCSAPDAGG